jgi:hypothetical protein
MRNVASAVIVLVSVAAAAGFQDDKEKLRTALKDSEPTKDWIYDDLGAGFAEAKKTGKPLMIVFR